MGKEPYNCRMGRIILVDSTETSRTEWGSLGMSGEKLLRDTGSWGRLTTRQNDNYSDLERINYK